MFWQRCRIAAPDGVRDHQHVVTLEGRLTHQHFVEHDPQRPDVGPVIDLLAARLFRRHVGHRADRRAGLRHALGPRQLGQPEVEDLHHAARGDEQIGGLDVPMHDAGAVRLSQPLADLRGDVDGLVQRQRPPLDPLLQCLALVVRHHEVELAVGGLVDLGNGADVGMVQRRGRLGFLEEPLLGRLVAGQARREELDGDLALQARVLSRINDPHAAVAELGSDRIRAERGTWGQRHREERSYCLRVGPGDSRGLRHPPSWPTKSGAPPEHRHPLPV